MYKRLLSGSAWALSGRLVGALAGLAMNALLARLLSPAEFGAYFLSLSVVTVAATVAQLGLTQTVVRLIAEAMGSGNPGRAREAIRLVLGIAAAGTLLVSMFIALGGGEWIARTLFGSEIMAGIAMLMAAWIGTVVFQQLIAESFRGFHDIRSAVAFGGLLAVLLAVSSLLIVWIVLGRSELKQVIAIIVVSGILSLIVSATLLSGKVRAEQLPAGGELSIPGILGIAWPLWATNIMLLVLSEAAVWIIGVFRPSADVAVYAAAVRTIVLVSLPLLIINAVVPPVIAEMHGQKRIHDLEKILRATATTASIPAFLALFVIMAFSDDLMSLLYGEFYRAGGALLLILSFGQLANVMAGSCGQVLMLTGNEKAMMLITMACGSLAVAGGFLTVRQFGATGVAASAAAGMVLQNVLMLVYAKKRAGVWTHVGLSTLRSINR